ncbi:GNAT family protein [Paracoccus sp. CPCC 101403]|uniref:GNAT family protein n=1 Tax=Paracoccus broussonetiae TaxID=3075834 RepID=A0ABU3EBU2_9RHOB|nr:GNAT family protein [Paracoccus sp. CPCC 101403]MDT1061342.1 GNAT family protein [Paracoccus sp. CPCC 101403]
MTEPYRVPDIFETDRYVVRRVRETDAEPIFHSYATDPVVTRFLTWLPATSPEDTRSNVIQCGADWDQGTRFASVITPRAEEGRILGMIDARLGAGLVGYGYVLCRAAWGQGCMTEILSWQIAHALAHPRIYRTEALCDVDNLASARVMEKAGMVREGVLRRRLISPAVSDEPRDCYLYAKVR